MTRNNMIDNTIDRTAGQRQAALFRGDVKRYYQLCLQEGVKPEFPDLYEQGRLEAIEGARKLKRTLDLEKTVSTDIQPQEQAKPKRQTMINYETFWKLATNPHIAYDNIFVQTEEKKRILRQAGYTHLTGDKGERVTLDSAKPTRIGNAFKHVYETAQRKFGNR